MKGWKVLMEYQGKITQVVVEAKYYSEASNKTEIEYPECKVYSITRLG